MKTLSLLIFFILCFKSPILVAQIFWDESESFSRIDTLRGTITEERAWWDLTYYDLSIQVFPEEKFINGTNTIHFEVVDSYKNDSTNAVLQIELQDPMRITKVVHESNELVFSKNGLIYLIQLNNVFDVNSTEQMTIYFEGNPKEAVRAPWDGGFSWTKDELGNWFIATSNQGEGASLWWPNKDHPYDEPDSLSMTVRVPSNLKHVGNGRIEKVQDFKDGTTSYSWIVTNPINNYGVNINIGNYVNFKEIYDGESGKLDVSFWVLKQHLDQAKEQFTQVPMMLKAFEYWFGPYPFYEDSFKLVEVPYLGMEHQSSVTYGNKFGNGYLGRDLSRTGEGLKFDFIIIHEAGHEWFANNITNSDVADMWIHEGFTSYSESLYLEYHFGKESAFRYTKGLRSNISNTLPVIGPYNVRKEGSSDMYYKGHNMLHTIRHIIDSDSTWRNILRGLNQQFKHLTVSSEEVETYINSYTSIDLSPVFDQYLRDIRIPMFTYRLFEDGRMEYQWTNTIMDFVMPIDIMINGTKTRLFTTNKVQEYKLPSSEAEILIDSNYYVGSLNLSTN